MQYFIAFLEGIITFISPCLLPMLPIYISYFSNGESDKSKTLKNSFGFVIGFSIVFISLGAFAGGVGELLQKYKTIINVVTGLIVIIIGLNFCGIIKIHFLNTTKKSKMTISMSGFFTSILFGIAFSIGWTPCVGTFLGAALMMASQKGSMLSGIIMLIFYSAGLGVPFIFSALIIDRLKGTLDIIKRHYRMINLVSGALLIIVGIMMMSGTLDYLLTLFSN